MTETKVNSSKKKEEEKQNSKKSGRHVNLQISYVNPIKDFQCTRTIRCFKLKELFVVLSIVLIIGLICAVVFLCSPYQFNTNVKEQELLKATDNNTTHPDPFRIISRFYWLAQPPVDPIAPIKTPVSLVIVHHTATDSCLSQAKCIHLTRIIQEYHIYSKGWSDIGYNFLVGGDGQAYEGRGWTSWGAHTRGYNGKSIGVGFIGIFVKKAPPENQVTALNNLLKRGVDLGYLTEDYKIMAACQFSNSRSPGKAFFEVMKTWDRWIEKTNDTNLGINC